MIDISNMYSYILKEANSYISSIAKVLHTTLDIQHPGTDGYHILHCSASKGRLLLSDIRKRGEERGNDFLCLCSSSFCSVLYVKPLPLEKKKI